MIWVSLPHATFGFIFDDHDIITDVPTIAKWARGRQSTEVARYFERRGADVRQIS